jgi:TATA-box binding protein (TBP) (component of TFIID and TFIIIB)
MFAPKVQDKFRKSCRRKAQAMTAIAEINKNLVNCLPPTKFGISTMNIMCCLSVKRVNLAVIKELFNDPDTKVVADESFNNTCVQLQSDHEFNNSVIVKYRYQDAVTIAIKLFVNGTLQISGCRCVEDALLNGQLMCRFLERMSDVETGTYTVVDFEVHMSNSNFELGIPGCLIDLAKLHDYINSNYRLFQRYDISNHAGLIITKMSTVASSSSITIMVFNNAQTIITGWKDWAELVDAYGTILSIVDESYEQVVRVSPGQNKL